jgi:hypothetical protein
MEELCGMSDVIVDGRVARVDAAQSIGEKLETPVHISVTQVLKGPALQSLLLIEPGGKLGARDEVYFNQIIPKVGERNVLFLKREDGIYRALGGLHGQYRIDADRVRMHPAMARVLRAEFSDVPVDKLLQSIREELKKP